MFRKNGILKKYSQKRNFNLTPEPKGIIHKNEQNVFVVQMHKARSLHYDFRIEINGVLKSWAVPKGPSTNPADKRLAVQTEDHPFDYKDFEGVIPKGNYGAGPVMIWDNGTYKNLKSKSMEECVESGEINIWLSGHKLKGGYALVRTKFKDNNSWILVKMNDNKADREHNIILEKPKSVVTKKEITQIAAENSAAHRSNAENSMNVDSSLKSHQRMPLRHNRTHQSEDLPDGVLTQGDQIVSSKQSRRLLLKTVIKKLELDLPGKIIKKSKITTINPMLAVLTKDYFDSEDYLYETKWDGERIVAYKINGKVTLLTRNNIDVTSQYKMISKAIEEQELDNFVLDGEVVALDATGKSNFGLLSNIMHTININEAVLQKLDIHYCIFDLMVIENYDLQQIPLLVRKKLLEKFISYKKPLQYTQHILKNGLEYFNKACGMNLEGIMAKNIYSQYVNKRSNSWLKFKCTKGQEFVIVGFTKSQSSRVGFGSLLLGYYDDKNLMYAGKVGTGFNTELLTLLSQKLNDLATVKSSLHNTQDVTDRNVQWVKPKLVAEISFTEWTKHNKLRHPSFKGLREDKDPKEVIKEIEL